MGLPQAPLRPPSLPPGPRSMPEPTTWTWTPPAREEPSSGVRSLADRLRACAEDRASSARALAREAARELRAWIAERPRGWGETPAASTSVGLELEGGLRPWAEGQAWRGPCALFLDTLRRAFLEARDGGQGPRDALLAELTAWSDEQGVGEWDGRPGTTGRRLPDPGVIAARAVEQLERGEALLVHGYSEEVIAAVVAAQQAGLAPQVIVGAGAPDQSGKRTARELSGRGVAVRVLWDAVVLSRVADCDRLWLGLEALAPDRFVGVVGTSTLLGEAARAEVPVQALCGRDAWMPGGELELPTWGEQESWSLWSHPPEEVALESQPFEAVHCELVGSWITERGLESLADFSLRALTLEPAPPCASPGREAEH